MIRKSSRLCSRRMSIDRLEAGYCPANNEQAGGSRL